MRSTHVHNVLHRVQYWTGSFFRPAQLWEVGCALVIPHYGWRALCDGLKLRQESEDGLQVQKDALEQQSFRHAGLAGETVSAVSAVTGVLAAFPTKEQLPIVFTDLAANVVPATFGDSTNEPHLYDFEEVDDDEIADVMPEETHEDPRTDMLGNRYVRVVHTNGIHNLCLVTCECNGRSSHMDLAHAGFLPTTFSQYRTLFSTAVLDDYRISNLECKSSISQYWQKLCRQTDSTHHPGHMLNLTRELGRLSRLWRWTKKTKWAGYGHNKEDPMDPKAGALAIYCSTCPQPAVNLPSGWQEDEKQ